MISLSATVRPVDSSYVLGLLAQRLRKHRHLELHSGCTLVHVPRVGPVLVSETTSQTVLQVVAADEVAASNIRELLEAEFQSAVPGRESRRCFAVAWERCATIPASLR